MGTTKQQEGGELSAAPLSHHQRLPFLFLSLAELDRLCTSSSFFLCPAAQCLLRSRWPPSSLSWQRTFSAWNSPTFPLRLPGNHCTVSPPRSLPPLSLLLRPLPGPVWIFPFFRVHLNYHVFPVLSYGATPPAFLEFPQCPQLILDLPCLSLIGYMFPSNSSRADALPHYLCVSEIFSLRSQEILVWIGLFFNRF